jgi:hypothetical protein
LGVFEKHVLSLSKESTALRPSPAMPGPRFGAKARCNWPDMT